MSKVIIKIGPETEKIEKDEISMLEFKDASPSMKFKYASDDSVVFFDRNPFYVIITEQRHLDTLLPLIKKINESGEDQDEDSKNENVKRLLIETEMIISQWVSRNLFDNFSQTLINALKNSKAVGVRIGKGNEK